MTQIRSVGEALLAHAAERPDAPAFHVLAAGRTTTLTWADLAARSWTYAERLRDAGVRPRQVVVICLKHGASLYPAFLGAMLAGAIPSFVSFPTPKQDPDLYWESHRVLFARVRAAAVVTYPANADDVRRVLPAGTQMLVDDATGTAAAGAPPEPSAPDLDDVALLQHSSGTTGHKKGVELTHRQIALQVRAYTAAQGMGADDLVASWLPVYHDMGLFTAFLGPVLLGSTTVSIDAFEWVDDPHLLFRAVAEHRCTFMWLPNFALGHLVRTKTGGEDYRLDHVRGIMVAAEPIKPATVDGFAAAFAPHGLRAEALLTAYGLAEAAMAVSLIGAGQPVPRRWFDPAALRLGRAVVREESEHARGYLSCGRVIDDIEVRVVADSDARGADAPEMGVPVGELQVRGPFTFSGYYHNPEATAAAFDGDWVRTGDLGCFVGDDLFVLGRSKDVIIQNGVNYYAHDIESVVSAIEGVKPGRCVAVPVEDDDAGSERIEVLAERELDADGNALRPDAQVRTEAKAAVLARYQVVIARVHLVPEGWLAKTTSGKISRADNLSRLLSEPPPGLDDATDGGAGPMPPDEAAPGGLEATVVQMIATTFDVPADSIGRRTVALDVPGWDSLGTSVLMIRLERALGIDIPESVAALSADVGEMVDRLAQLAGEAR